MAADVARLWGFVLAEATGKTRQRLDLPSPSTTTTSTASSRVLDAETSRSLRDECLSRGVRLESVLMASLFMAAAEAVRLSGRCRATEEPFRMRLQRALVLGLVCLVMTLLSGSIDSKALRYFCSFYAVFAGAWAVNIVTVEPPGFIFLMATSASAAKKGGDDPAAAVSGRGPTSFSPSRLAVDSLQGGGLWGTAERHMKQSLARPLSGRSFARFKWWSRGLRSALCWGWPWRRPKLADTSAAANLALDTGERRRPYFQLFGCIQRDRRGVAGAAHAPSSTSDGYDGVPGRVPPARNEDGATEHDVERMQENVAALLTALEARYTLIYRGTPPETVVPPSGGDEGAGLRGSGEGGCGSELVGGGGSCGGAGDGSHTIWGADGGHVAPSEAPPGGLELTLVSGGVGSGWFQGGGSSSAAGKGGGDGDGDGDGDGGGKGEEVEGSVNWLLDHAVASLLDAIPSARREA